MTVRTRKVYVQTSLVSNLKSEKSLLVLLVVTF
jgi:hypothetical protein